MLRDITLGQYFPGNSPVHRLDPRTKLLGVVFYIVALFSAVKWISYGVCLVFLALSIRISRISLKAITRGLKPLLFIMIFTAVLNVLFTGGETVLLDLGKVQITLEGLERAFFMVTRIMMLVTGSFLMTYTTSPIALTDGLETLLNPLKRLRLPVHELAMIMCIALRFIPTLIEETDKIISAQKARGADFETGSLIQRAKALIPVLVPLIISAFRRADDLSVAMECRCYQGGEGRTKMKQLRYTGLDAWAFCAFGVLLAAVFTLRYFGL